MESRQSRVQFTKQKGPVSVLLRSPFIFSSHPEVAPSAILAPKAGTRQLFAAQFEQYKAT